MRQMWGMHRCRRGWREGGESVTRGPMRRRGHGGGRGLRRFFAHGDLRFLVLKLLEDKPRHGYEIIKAIEEGLAGAYVPSPGVIYPTLAMLEELGWTREADGEGGKRPFELTEEGRAALEANRTTVEAILARMAEVKLARGAQPSPDIEAGVEEVRRAILLRMVRGALTDDDTAAIVAALNSAAKTIAES